LKHKLSVIMEIQNFNRVWHVPYLIFLEGMFEKRG